MKPSLFISPYDAMWREVGCLYRALEQAREELERALEGVTPAAFLGGPDPGGPSIASLLLACGAEEASWIHRRFRKTETPLAPAG